MLSLATLSPRYRCGMHHDIILLIGREHIICRRCKRLTRHRRLVSVRAESLGVSPCLKLSCLAIASICEPRRVDRAGTWLLWKSLSRGVFQTGCAFRRAAEIQ